MTKKKKELTWEQRMAIREKKHEGAAKKRVEVDRLHRNHKILMRNAPRDKAGTKLLLESSARIEKAEHELVALSRAAGSYHNSVGLRDQLNDGRNR